MYATRVFFFSSRRRHTRCGRDWSSDVCSSDLSPAPPPTISLIPGGAASPAGQGSRSPAESSHFGIGDPGKCRPLAPSKRVNVLSPGRSRYSAAFVATHRFWFSSVETPTTGISWMPSCQLYCTLLIGHGPGPPNLIPPPSAGPASAGPASAGPASTEGPASTVGPASTGTMLFPGSVTLLFAQAAPISAPAIAHFPTFPTTPPRPSAAWAPSSLLAAGQAKGTGPHFEGGPGPVSKPLNSSEKNRVA